MTESSSGPRIVPIPATNTTPREEKPEHEKTEGENELDRIQSENRKKAEKQAAARALRNSTTLANYRLPTHPPRGPGSGGGGNNRA